MEPVGRIVIEDGKFYILLTDGRREDLEIARVELPKDITDYITDGLQKDIDKFAKNVSKEEEEETGQIKRKQVQLDYVKSRLKY